MQAGTSGREETLKMLRRTSGKHLLKFISGKFRTDSIFFCKFDAAIILWNQFKNRI